MPEEDQFGFLQRAQQEARFFTSACRKPSVEQIQRAQRFFAVVSVQNRFNLVDRRMGIGLDYCERENIAFIPWYPLQIGAAGEGEAIGAIAARYKATPSQIALAWLLRRSPVMLPIPGTSRVRHLEENVAAAGIWLTEAGCSLMTLQLDAATLGSSFQRSSVALCCRRGRARPAARGR